MKKIFPMLLLWCLSGSLATAQLPNGTIAPNFTGIDINGVSHNLYNLLNSGKTVYLDFSATWCHICWDYHNTQALKTIWNTYGPPGTNEAYVLFIEGDASTNTACLYGNAGCSGSSSGNWVAGTPFPIIESATIADLYDISYFPTIYCICPSDKKVYLTGQLSASALWNFRSNYCTSGGTVQLTVNSVTNVRCFNTNTGAVDISIASGGVAPYTYAWSNGATSQDLTNIPAGAYTVTVTAANGWTGSSSISVAAPPSALTLLFKDRTLVGCNGITGSVTVESTGGWNNYVYTWNNGQSGATATNLSPGNYTVTTTDGNNCTKTLTVNVAPPVYPTAIIAAPGTITCANTSLQLNGNSSSNGSNYTYQWTTSNGGVIASGGATLTPTVTAGGSYQLLVTDNTNACTSTSAATVNTNTTPPGATASGGTITCTNTQTTLNATSTVNTVNYSWTGPNGYTSNLKTPSVNVSGAYNLMVTNTVNGCTSTAVATVNLHTTPPNASASTLGNLNCNNVQLQLNGNNSSQGAGYNYQWTTTNGNIVAAANTLTPLVNQVGNYTLLVTNTDNGCTSTAATSVAQSPAVTANISNQNNVTCNGASNGFATVTAGGGNNTYAYAWTNGNNTAAVGSLVAGTYLVTVTDGENCTSSTSVVITQPATLTINSTVTGQTINNVNNGTATVTPNGGTGIYTYLWNNGSTIANITGLAPGNYTVIVTDANACSAVETVTVNAFNCLLSATVGSTNLTCFGANNGTASVILTGAATPVTYAWSNGANTPSAQNLAAGTYSVALLDANNCPATLNVSIGEPLQLATNATANGETFAGANNGTATATPTGGTSGYTFLWSNGSTSASITGLASGIYTVIVTDANACTAAQTIVVTAFDCSLTAQTMVSNVTCAGAANGSISLTQIGGTAPFTYNWSNGSTTATINDLLSGTYTVFIVDANNCQIMASANVSAPAPYSNFSVQSSNPICPNEPTGSAAVSISGGTTPYKYLWSNGGTTSSITNLSLGNYTLVLTDANACTTSTSVAIVATDNAPPTLSVQNTTVSLNANGTATITLATVNAQYSDNCTVVSAILHPTTFDCSQKGPQSVTVTVTDMTGLVTTATSVVNIVDDIAPILSCPNNTTVCFYNNTVNYNPPVVSDNCLLVNDNPILTSGLPSGSVFPVGTTMQTFAFADASNNVGTCSFEVTIIPAVKFDNVQVTNNQNNSSINITISGGTQPYSFVWTNNNGQTIGNTEDIGGLANGIYFVQVTDANGCNFNAPGIEVNATSLVAEPKWLFGVRMYPNPTSDLTGILFDVLPTTALEISVFDATGRVVMTQISEGQSTVMLDCSALPTGLYSVRFRSNNEVGVRKLMVNR